MVAIDDGLPLDYRKKEMLDIVRCIRAGASCSVVGVSGMAKSNLYRFLLRVEARHHYLGDDWARYLFLGGDSHALGELSEEAMYALLLHRLVAEAHQREVDTEVVGKIGSLRDRSGRAASGRAWTQAFLQALAVVLTAESARQVVFLFDQFDEVYTSFNPRFFANLRAIRDEFKYRVSYVAFTRVELPHLCQAPECQEFYELLSPNVVGLGPHNHRDSWVLLQRVAGRYGVELDRALGDRLITLTGGHPGLLKSALLSSLREAPIPAQADVEVIDVLLTHDRVLRECRELWDSVGEDERKTLSAVAEGFPLHGREQAALRRLEFKGLVSEEESGAYAVFCDLFKGFVVDQEEAEGKDLVIEEQTGQVWVDGKEIGQDLTKLEFSLLCYLNDRAGEVCTRDEIVSVLYPDEVGDPRAAIPDSRVDTLVGRLREKIERDRSRPRYILTVRGRGYKLGADRPEGG